MRRAFTESEVARAALDWPKDSGWAVASDVDIAPGERAAERDGIAHE